MSNVLIGIIGVILFIGLALAGALFLGPRFQESTDSSSASALAAQMAQVSQAASMAATYGETLSTSNDVGPQLVTKGFLKAVPVSPISPNTPALTNASSAKVDGNEKADVVVMYIGYGPGTRADRVCTLIGRQMGQIAANAITSVSSDGIPTASNGCFRKSGSSYGVLGVDSFYVFSRI